MTFEQWLAQAKRAENASLDELHFYLQLNSVGPDV
jgi:hypothetical protein